MVGKWSTMTIIDQRPISRLCPLLTPNLLRQQEKICNVRGSQRKGPRKRKGKGQEKIENGKKSPNFVLWACTELKYCKMSYPVFGTSIFLVKKIAFLGSGQPKN